MHTSLVRRLKNIMVYVIILNRGFKFDEKRNLEAIQITGNFP